MFEEHLCPKHTDQQLAGGERCAKTVPFTVAHGKASERRHTRACLAKVKWRVMVVVVVMGVRVCV